MTEKLTVRAALDAARDRAPIGLDEAVTLLSCAGDDLVELQSIAGALRDEGLAAVGRSRQVTYSRKVFIPLTRLCRDKCHYCTFVTVPGKLRAAGEGMFLDPDEVEQLVRLGRRRHEAHPEGAQPGDDCGTRGQAGGEALGHVSSLP